MEAVLKKEQSKFLKDVGLFRVDNATIDLAAKALKSIAKDQYGEEISGS